MSANRRNSNKYDEYKNALSGDSDTVLFARLAYAETLAANCTDQNDEVLERVVGVVGNRINRRNGDVKSVVFQRDQFSSSLNNYGSSKYKDFLCPQDEALWSQTLARVRRFMHDKETSVSNDTMNYFFFKHDPRWTEAPAWGLEENTEQTNPQIQSCIRTYRNPGWK